MGTTDDITTTIFQQKANARSKLKQKSKTDIDDRLTCEKQLKSLQNELKEIKSNKVVEEQMRIEVEKVQSQSVVEKDEQQKQEKKKFEATIRQMGFEINDLKRFHSDLRNENDHLSSEMDKTTNEKYTLQEKMKSEIEDLKESYKRTINS